MDRDGVSPIRHPNLDPRAGRSFSTMTTPAESRIMDWGVFAV